jgi:hypothetical protein
MTMMKPSQTLKPSQPVKTRPRRFKKNRMSGRDSTRGELSLKAGAAVLAIAAALFPWYVFLNQEKFGISVDGWEQLRNVRSFRHRDAVEVPPMAIARAPDDIKDPSDTLVTATIPKAGPGGDGTDMGTTQPFPGRSGFRLLHVANGRAMIEDGNGMYIVQKGSILPDNSRLAAMTQKNGKWVIITSTGETYESAK